MRRLLAILAIAFPLALAAGCDQAGDSAQAPGAPEEDTAGGTWGDETMGGGEDTAGGTWGDDAMGGGEDTAGGAQPGG